MLSGRSVTPQSSEASIAVRPPSIPSLPGFGLTAAASGHRVTLYAMTAPGSDLFPVLLPGSDIYPVPIPGSGLYAMIDGQSRLYPRHAVDTSRVGGGD